MKRRATYFVFCWLLDYTFEAEMETQMIKKQHANYLIDSKMKIYSFAWTIVSNSKYGLYYDIFALNFPFFWFFFLLQMSFQRGRD